MKGKVERNGRGGVRNKWKIGKGKAERKGEGARIRRNNERRGRE